MTDFRPYMPLALEEFVDKILMESFSLRKKTPDTHPEFGHPHSPTHRQIFVAFLLEG